MATLKSLMIYLIANYPHPDELSKARLTKMVYLADWKSALSRGKQITSIKWKYDNFGPFVPDVYATAKAENDTFEVTETFNFFGSSKSIISLKSGYSQPELEPSEAKIADHVIRTTEDKTYAEFIRLVYSTYPIIMSEQFTQLNLVNLAEKYKQAKKEKNS